MRWDIIRTIHDTAANDLRHSHDSRKTFVRLSHDIRPNVAKPLSHWDGTACDSLQLIFASKSQSGLETVAVIRNFLACAFRAVGWCDGAG